MGATEKFTFIFKRQQNMNFANKTIVFQGDSITDCGRARTQDPNVNLGNGYVFFNSARILADNPDSNIKIFNRGISGNRIVDLYARWKSDCLNHNPDILSILIGINDTWHGFKSNNGVEPERYERFYREILEWTKKECPNIELVLCEPFMLPLGAAETSWVDEVTERRNIVKKMAETFDAKFVAFQTVFDNAIKKAPDDYWLPDGVHPTSAGHQLMSDAFFKAIAD